MFFFNLNTLIGIKKCSVTHTCMALMYFTYIVPEIINIIMSQNDLIHLCYIWQNLVSPFMFMRWNSFKGSVYPVKCNLHLVIIILCDYVMYYSETEGLKSMQLLLGKGQSTPYTSHWLTAGLTHREKQPHKLTYRLFQVHNWPNLHVYELQEETRAQKRGEHANSKQKAGTLEPSCCDAVKFHMCTL